MITVKQIARETMPLLMDSLVFPNMVYRDTVEATSARQGDTILVRRPVRMEASSFDSAAGVESDPMPDDTVEVTLDTLATVDASVSAWDTYDEEAIRKLFVEPAAAALAEKINADGLRLYRDIYQTAGTPGEVPTGLDNLADAAYALDMAKVPTDRRCAVWSPYAAAQLKQIPAVVNAEKCGDNTALRTGAIGSVFGVEHYMSQAVCQHKAGTLADHDVSVEETVADSDTLTLGGSSMEGLTLLHGDILHIGDKNYTVLEDAVSAGDNITVKVSPAVTAEKGTAVRVGGGHEANLVFHPNAFAFVTRPLSAPAGVESYVTTYNGISLRVVRGYDMRYKREMLSMDVLYGFKTIYPELAVRYMA